MTMHRYYATWNGQTITCASKSAKIKFLLVVFIPGTDGATLLEGFPTERKAMNWAEREAWDLDKVKVLPATTEKPQASECEGEK